MKPTDADVLETPAFACAASALEELLALAPGPGGARPAETTPVSAVAPAIGNLTGFCASGSPLVGFKENPGANPIGARSACDLTEADLGREVVLLFEGNDYLRPIVIGVLRPPASRGEGDAGGQPLQVELDGEQVTLTAKKRLVLRCGGASITLTSAGKVLIQGAYLSSHASGLHRIKGGSVQIN